MNQKQKAIKDHYIKAFIDSGMSEEEAESLYNEYQYAINEDGILTDISTTTYKKVTNKAAHLWSFEQQGIYPRTLKDLPSNNGWSRIEDGLPEDKAHCWFIDNHGEMYNGTHHAIINEFRSGNKCFGYEEVYYWQPITKPNLPLY